MDQVNSGALRDAAQVELDARVLDPKRARRERLGRASASEIALVAASVALPAGVTDVMMVTGVTLGERLPNGSFSGKGGITRHGPAWVLEGRISSAPIHLFDNVRDGLALHALLVGEEGELWQRKQRRLEAIASAEAAEAEALAISKENARTVARSNEDGGGSSRRSRSREKPTASSGPGMSRRERLRRASKPTS